MNKGLLVCIEGLIGCGKSTLVKGLADNYKHVPFYEPVETNPYLGKYYEDPSRWAFTMQVHLLWERYKMHQEAYYKSLTGSVCLLDRSPEGDKAFALVQNKEGYFTPSEFDSYLNMSNILHSQRADADLVIWLDLPPEKALERISKRARGCESGIPLNYLIDLDNAYRTVLDDLSKRTQVITIDATQNAQQVLSIAGNIIGTMTAT